MIQKDVRGLPPPKSAAISASSDWSSRDPPPVERKSDGNDQINKNKIGRGFRHAFLLVNRSGG